MTATTLPSTKPPPPRGGPVKSSKMGRWRAAALIAVHVLFAAHLLHWSIAGSTLTPVEPSESMWTLEAGLINAGVIFFAVTILATLVLGRWFCGWACHVVALQDLCAWLCNKVGLRPQPMRSRVLAWAPLLLAFYMFAWPTLKRVANGRPAPNLEWHLLTENLWETFAGPWMALTTFAVCGFLVVYWLGAKGFCTYGCPYGAIYGLVDRAAVGRIRVTDACRGCRHCTAACTSNVLVHEEVLRHGMVVDPGCMKCMDCVNVCPKGALYFGLGKPAWFATKHGQRISSLAGDLAVFALVTVLAGLWILDSEREVIPNWLTWTTAAAIGALLAFTGRRGKSFDLTRVEELVVAVIFLTTSQWVFRKLYEAVPNLLAIGLGALTAFGAISTWRMLRASGDFKLQNHELRKRGKLTPRGLQFVALVAVWFAFTAHSWYVQSQFRAVDALVNQAARSPRDRQLPIVKRALERANALETWSLFDTSRLHDQRGQIRFRLGDVAGAERDYARSVELNPKSASSWLGLHDVRIYKGRDPRGALNALEQLLQRYPNHPEAVRRVRAMRGPR